MDALQPARGGLYVDCTLGGGGHSLGILKASQGHSSVIGLDRDREAIEAARERLSAAGYSAHFRAVQARFSTLKSVLEELGVHQIDGLIADLGFSSPQIDLAERGFSYLQTGPLDMRMNQSEGETASDLIARLSEDELHQLLRAYGEDRYARSIARAIVQARGIAPLTTTTALAEVVANAVPARARRDKHPARRTFQALRIAVNQEIQELEQLLEDLPELMAPGGVVAIICFHSLEDQCVKRAFRKWQNPCQCPRDLPCTCGLVPLGKTLSAKPPSAAEMAANPRARSAHLRAFRFKEALT